MDEEIPQLTTGVCDQIASSTGPGDPVWSSSPILQILQARNFDGGSQRRWRTVISDGVHAQIVLVDTQLNPLFENGEARKGSIVRLQRFAVDTILDRRILVIRDLEVLAKDVEKIGNPYVRASRSDVPEVKYNFSKLDELVDKPKDSACVTSAPISHSPLIFHPSKGGMDSG